MTGVSQPAAGDRDEGFGYRWIILAVGILAYGTSQFSRQNYTGVQKFIAEDLSLDRGTIGLMGSAFFYAYALFQMPWGIASDRFGSRAIIGLGILLTAVTMLGFATAASSESSIVWRILSGIAAAAVYVPLTGAIARWFRDSERSFSQGTLGGVGGAMGEGMAFFLLPVLAIYFASGWRQGMNMLAFIIAVMGVLCLALLKSAPSGRPATTKKPFDWSLFADVQLWCYAFLYSGFVVGIRLTQAWIAVYAADVYIFERGMSLNDAVVAGGLLALLAYSLTGRAIGCPIAGTMSDVFAKTGYLAHGRTFHLARRGHGDAATALDGRHVDLGDGDHRGAARHVREPLFPHPGSHFGNLRTAPYRDALLVHEHGRPARRRHRPRGERLRRNLAQQPAWECAHRIPRHLAVRPRGDGQHDRARPGGVCGDPDWVGRSSRSARRRDRAGGGALEPETTPGVILLFA